MSQKSSGVLVDNNFYSKGKFFRKILQFCISPFVTQQEPTIISIPRNVDAGTSKGSYNSLKKLHLSGLGIVTPTFSTIVQNGIRSNNFIWRPNVAEHPVRHPSNVESSSAQPGHSLNADTKQETKACCSELTAASSSTVCCRCSETKSAIDSLLAEVSELKRQVESLNARKSHFDAEVPSNVGSGCPTGPTHFIPPPPPLPPAHLFSIPKDPLQAIKEARLKKEKILKSYKKDSNIDMTEVLKGMKDVKLRQIARSPGGTPFRTKKASYETGNDHASYFIRALRKKFSGTVPESPDRNSDSSLQSPNWSFLDAETPPKTTTDSNYSPTTQYLKLKRFKLDVLEE